ncbi:ABC transporter substrate-binding protein [Sorangium sp. So ce185]|uniref:cytochrome c/ABC transporter substrate-binding protein n=1 Tax=Sorangium sp. So ce185 TaxID=3133287 RepID=UPI003F5DDF87
MSALPLPVWKSSRGGRRRGARAAAGPRGRLRLLLAAAPAIALGMVALRAVGGGDRAPAARAGAGEAQCAELTPPARRGKRIYQRGVTADGRAIEGAIVGGAAALSGRDAACAGCHGASGQGTYEGGIEAPPLAADRRLASRGARGPSGGQGEAAIDAAALAAAVREGRGRAGQRLSPVMPQYRLSAADLSDLAAYLGCVGRDLDPGVTADAVVLGAALPLTGPAAPAGEAVRDVLSAAFAEVNAQGGIYQRRLELRVEDSGGPAGEAGATERLLEGGVLALVGSVLGEGAAVRARLSEERAPLVGPVAGALGAPGGVGAPALVGGAPGLARDAAGAAAAGGEDVVFRVWPGPDVLARVAIKHFAGAPANAGAPALIVHARDREGEAWASGARAEAAGRGLPALPALSFEPGRLSPGDVAGAAQAHGARAILFWGPGKDLAGARAALDDAGSAAPIYAPLGSVVGLGEPLSGRLSDRVLFVHAGLSGERERASGAALRASLRRAGVAPGPLGAQATAYVAAQIAIEALKRAGAHVTREGLIAALERLRGFDAGPAPPVTFARNRRTGVLGASLVRIDPASGGLVRASAWIEVVP